MRRTSYAYALPSITIDGPAEPKRKPGPKPSAAKPAPIGCRACQHYVAKTRECSVLRVLLADCFVIRQAVVNAERGIKP
jgi:hypothetical protein